MASPYGIYILVLSVAFGRAKPKVKVSAQGKQARIDVAGIDIAVYRRSRAREVDPRL